MFLTEGLHQTDKTHNSDVNLIYHITSKSTVVTDTGTYGHDIPLYALVCAFTNSV